MAGDVAEGARVPEISVLVCTRNRAEPMAKCARSILASGWDGFELVVIDQSDGDDTARLLAEIDDPRLRYLTTPTRGLARARNVGIEATAAPIVLFTDDDNYAEPDWVEAIAAEFRRDPRLDAVYGRVMAYGESPGDGWTCPTIMESMEPRLVEGLQKGSVQQSVGHGNNMAFRRSCFVNHGLFLEWLGAGSAMKGGEDTDFSFRLLRAGARMYYSPDPVVHHDNWMKQEDANRQLRGYMVGGSAVFTRFILRGSWTALRVQWHYVGEYWKCWKWYRSEKDAVGVAHMHRLVLKHLAGVWWGLAFVFRTAKRYRAGQRTYSWHEHELQRPVRA